MSKKHSRLYPTIRPLVAKSIDGLVFKNDTLIALDSRNGYLLQVNPFNNDTRIVNHCLWEDFLGARGLSLTPRQLWFTCQEYIYHCEIEWQKDNLTLTSKPRIAFSIPYPANGIAIFDKTVYITSERAGYIYVYSLEGEMITKFNAPGVGVENITVKGDELWVCDNIEQTVYCLDRATGETKYSIITPFEHPSALGFLRDSKTAHQVLYVAYSDQEPYIRDNPNSDPSHELAYRPRTFIHPLYFKYFPDKKYTLSNGFLIEMTYVEEISPLDHATLKDVEWRIALPAESPRQRVKKVEPVGIPFVIEEYDGQKVALFRFPELSPHSRHIFGWRAILEVWSIKYQYKPRDCENLPPLPPEYEDKYLIDDDNLAMNTDIVLRAAEEARGDETNILRKLYNIRNYVYDHLRYGMKSYIDPPDIVLKRGVGSCGEYLGVLLALCRLNGIACRTVGRYKCPRQQVLHFGVPLIPQFNHVWMEFYLPGIGWLPMESNPDDIEDCVTYPTRFFMGLAWYHMEMAKDIPFETLKSEGEYVSREVTTIGRLAINHIYFTILEELPPY